MGYTHVVYPFPPLRRHPRTCRTFCCIDLPAFRFEENCRGCRRHPRSRREIRLPSPAGDGVRRDGGATTFVDTIATSKLTLLTCASPFTREGSQVQSLCRPPFSPNRFKGFCFALSLVPHPSNANRWRNPPKHWGNFGRNCSRGVLTSAVHPPPKSEAGSASPLTVPPGTSQLQ